MLSAGPYALCTGERELLAELGVGRGCRLACCPPASGARSKAEWVGGEETTGQRSQPPQGLQAQPFARVTEHLFKTPHSQLMVLNILLLNH